MAVKVLKPQNLRDQSRKTTQDLLSSILKDSVAQQELKLQREALNIKLAESISQEQKDNEIDFSKIHDEILKSINKGDFGLAENYMLGYNSRLSRMVREENRNLYFSEADLKLKINEGKRKESTSQRNFANLANPNLSIEDKQYIVQGILKEVSKGNRPVSDIDQMFKISGEANLDESLGFSDPKAPKTTGLTRATIQSGMSKTYTVVSDFRTKSAFTDENRNALANELKIFPGDIAKKEVQAQIIQEFGKRNITRAESALQQIQSSIMYGRPGEPTLFEQVGDIQKQALVDQVGGIIIESIPELANLSGQELKDMLSSENESEKAKKLRQEFGIKFVKTFGTDEWQNYLSTARFEILEGKQSAFGK